MKVDLEELKRLQGEAQASVMRRGVTWKTMPVTDEIAEFHNAVVEAFPAIVANLEAAQKLRDELSQIMEKPVTSMTDGADRFAFIYSALAAFDKETE